VGTHGARKGTSLFVRQPDLLIVAAEWFPKVIKAAMLKQAVCGKMRVLEGRLRSRKRVQETSGDDQ
jgi:hypothetical protein